MKKIFLSIFLLIFSFPLISFAERIDNFETTVKVNTDSSIDVTEKITYVFDGQKHGIYRDIPYKYQNNNGDIFYFSIDDISVPDNNFVVSNEWKYKRIKIGDADRTISGTREYTINYKVHGAMGYFDNFDEIYWNTTGNEWEVPISRASATVILPKTFSGSEISKLQTSCYRGALGDKDNCSGAGDLSGNEYGVDRATFSTANLNIKEGMTVAVGFPKNIIEVDNTNHKSGILAYIFDLFYYNMVFLLPIITFFAMLYLWYTKGRDPGGRGVIIPQYDVPDDLTPMEVATIMYQKTRNKDLSAEMIYLAIKGYLKIEKIAKTSIFGKDDYVFRRTEKQEENLKKHEGRLLNYLFNFGIFKQELGNFMIPDESLKMIEEMKIKEEQGEQLNYNEKKLIQMAESKERGDVVQKYKEVKLSELQLKFYERAKDVSEEVIKKSVSDGYYEKNPTKESSKHLVIAFLLFFVSLFLIDTLSNQVVVSLIVSAVIIAIFSFVMPKKTEKGMEIHEYILGLKEYLQIAEKDRINFHNAPEKRPEVFEKFLPYAMVLGVEKAWAKEFEGIYTTPPSWYNDPSGMSTFNAVAFTSNLNNFSSYASSTLSSAPGGDSGSGGGGSSGGGGGGGGGGSW